MQISVSEEKGVRQLHFSSRWVQGAMRISKPWDLELEYTREMLLPLAFNPDIHWPRNALMIGLGAGALPKFLYKNRPECVVKVVEISAAVHAASMMHFKLPSSNPRFQIEIDCGAAYVAQSTEQFDLIIIDGFDENAKVGPLNSIEFYGNVRKRLSPGGVVAVNLLSNQKDSEQSKVRLMDGFEGRALVLPPCSSGNVVGFGVGKESIHISEAEFQLNLKHLQETIGLNLSATAARMRQAQLFPAEGLRIG